MTKTATFYVKMSRNLPAVYCEICYFEGEKIDRNDHQANKNWLENKSLKPLEAIIYS